MACGIPTTRTTPDNYYYWTAGVVGEEPANSTVFTKFLASLNDPTGCFAGECDWRLPTRDELLTIAVPGCTVTIGGPTACIDPVFGPTFAFFYWSDTTFPLLPSTAWQVFFAGFGTAFDDRGDAIAYDRAVRGGL